MRRESCTRARIRMHETRHARARQCASLHSIQHDRCSIQQQQQQQQGQRRADADATSRRQQQRRRSAPAATAADAKVVVWPRCAADPTFLPSYLSTFLTSYPLTFLPLYLPTSLPPYLPTFLPPYLPTFLPSYTYRWGRLPRMASARRRARCTV